MVVLIVLLKYRIQSSLIPIISIILIAINNHTYLNFLFKLFDVVLSVIVLYFHFINLLKLFIIFYIFPQ